MHARQDVSFLVGNLILAVVFCGCGKSSENVTASIESADVKAEQLDDKQPAVLVRTSLGEMTISLDAENAPGTVDNFLAYVNNGHYDGIIFHQVATGYMILGGSYDRDMRQRKADFPVRNEAHNGKKNLKGTISMARDPSAIDSASDQFFINLADNPDLDHRDRTAEGYGYCTFGRVSAGEDVLERIAAVAVHDQDGLTQIPIEPVVIESVRRIR